MAPPRRRPGRPGESSSDSLPDVAEVSLPLEAFARCCMLARGPIAAVALLLSLDLDCMIFSTKINIGLNPNFLGVLTYLIVLVEAKGAVAFVGGDASLVEVVPALEHLEDLVLVPLVDERHRALVAAQVLRHASFDLKEDNELRSQSSLHSNGYLPAVAPAMPNQP